MDIGFPDGFTVTGVVSSAGVPLGGAFVFGNDGR